MLYSYMLWLTPLWALFPGLSLLITSLRLLFKSYLFGFLPSALFLTHTGLPTAAAAAAWRYAEKYPRFFLFFLPGLGAVLFISRVGLNAHAWFAAFWTLLPLLYFVRSHTVARALISSLVAHIVGTLIVAFFGASVMWSTLVPLVPFERFVAAAGMLMVAAGISFFKRALMQRPASVRTSIE